jgi:hypothetical protein
MLLSNSSGFSTTLVHDEGCILPVRPAELLRKRNALDCAQDSRMYFKERLKLKTNHQYMLQFLVAIPWRSRPSWRQQTAEVMPYAC